MHSFIPSKTASVRIARAGLVASSALWLAACSSLSTTEQSASPWPQWYATTCRAAPLPDVSPEAISRRAPSIKSNWFPQGASVEVAALMEVTPEGKLGRVGFNPADTDSRVLKAIESSLKFWRFKAAQKDGKTIVSCMEQPYDLRFPAVESSEPEAEAEAEATPAPTN